MPTISSRPNPRYSRAFTSVAMIANSPARNSDINSRNQFVAAHPKMFRDLGGNRRERADAQRAVSRDSYVTFAALPGGDSVMTAGLTRGLVAENSERLHKVVAR